MAVVNGCVFCCREKTIGGMTAREGQSKGRPPEKQSPPRAKMAIKMYQKRITATWPTTDGPTAGNDDANERRAHPASDAVPCNRPLDVAATVVLRCYAQRLLWRLGNSDCVSAPRDWSCVAAPSPQQRRSLCNQPSTAVELSDLLARAPTTRRRCLAMCL